MSKINRVNVLSISLAIVAFWFGYKEVVAPADWASLVPGFFGDAKNTMVMLHGGFLILCGLALVFNFYRRIAAGILALMLLDIIVILFNLGGITDVVVRDIGLFGMAVALTLRD